MPKDMAGEWLKKYDPEYKRRKKLLYSYLSGRQMGEKWEKEISVSCLDTFIVQEWTGMMEEELLAVKALFT